MSSLGSMNHEMPATAISPPGLSSTEAARRLDQYGPNEPAAVRRDATLLELVFLFLNPLVIILLVASIVSLLLGDATDAIVIFVIVLLGVSISFIQTYRSEQAINRLREKVTPTATVLRDGNWTELPRQQIVPGDVVRISAGDLIPADGDLLEARDLYVQQAALTGESMPVEKAANRARAGNHDQGGPNQVFLGTS